MDISKLTCKQYLTMSSSAAESLASSLRDLVRDYYEISLDSRGILAVESTYRIRFRFVPGGKYSIGLTDSQELAARRIADPFPASIEEMRPVHHVESLPLLISEAPICNELAEATASITRNSRKSFPAMLSKVEADIIANRLSCRIPTESEWEIGCRAGTSTLFAFGDRLLETGQLASWMEWDLAYPLRHPANSFGLIGLYFGEWCSDLFTSDYSGTAVVEDGSYVVRGGGAYFWPWQDDEWVWCMSAVRMPSSALPSEGMCAARLVYDLS
jgi:hypothetical protein